MTNKLDDTMLEKYNIILSHNSAVFPQLRMQKPPNTITTLLKLEVRRKRFGKVTANLSKTKSLVSTLINCSVTAEQGTSKANTLANWSVKISQDVQEANTAYQEELKYIHADNV